MQVNNNSEVHSFDEVLDAKYGTPGSPEREAFRRKAYAYCVNSPVRDTHKKGGVAR